MPHPVTAQSLYDHHQEQLELEWIAGKDGAQRQLDSQQLHQSTTSLVGHLNLIRPCFIQVLGKTELVFLRSQGKNSLQDALDSLFLHQPVMVIVADDEAMHDSLIMLANKTHTPLCHSPLESNRIIDHLHYSLGNLLSDKLIQHGVFMEVMGLGVLLTGPSGVGKSELALELISRGHRLVADDAPEFRRTSPKTVHGRCPAVLADFLEVRGLGLINVRAMFGNNAVVANKRLYLIIQIQPPSAESTTAERLDTTHLTRSILEVDIPEVILPVAPGRDLAVIIEAAVRNHVLVLNGYNAADDFITRQQKEINKQSS